jgi:hypothetical protein
MMMSSQMLEGSWENNFTDLFTLTSISIPISNGENGVGTAIVGASSTITNPPPFVQYRFTASVDLSKVTELRFWFRSSRIGHASPENPFYLSIEATSDPPGLVWSRLLPIRQTENWEFHRLWLEDMPNSLRQAVSFLKLRSLDAKVAFSSTISDPIAATLEPIQDVDTALLRRLDGRFSALVRAILTNIPAFVDLPENPGDRTLPYILVTPWSVQPQRERGGSGEIIDNYTTEGAFVRPSPWLVQLDYSIDVFAQDRSQKTVLLDDILSSFSRQPFLMVAGEPFTIMPFTPSPEETARYVSPGRTPLFYRLTVQVETGNRQFQRQAIPFLLMGSIESKGAAEAIRL